MRREIVFSARDNGVSSFMDKMRKSSVEVGRGILQDSMAQSRSAKEAVKEYERQIALIEKKNRLEKESARVEAERRRDRDLERASSPDEKSAAKDRYSQSIKEINSSSREDKIQTDLLRELIRTVRSAGEADVRGDRQNADQASDDLERFLDGEDSSDFRNTVSRLREESAPEEESKIESVKSGANSVSQRVSRVANSGDGTSAMQNTLDSIGKGPILGTVVGLVATAIAGLNVRASRERSTELMSALSNVSNQRMTDSDIGGTDFFNGYGPNTYGVSREDFMSQYLPQAARSAGTIEGSGRRAMRHIELEKAYGLTQGTGASMTRLGRVAGEPDSHKMANNLYSAMYGTGALGKGNTDFTRMEEIISTMVQFGEGQLMSGGVTSGAESLKVRRGLEQLGGRFTRDDYALSTMQQMNAGLASEGSAESRAIKFDILRKQNPKKSFFELQMEMDKGIDSKGYLEGMLNFVKSKGGNLNSQALLMQGLTGGQMRNADIHSILKGDMSIEDFVRRDSGIQGRAQQSTSKANEQLLNFTEQFRDLLSGIGKGPESAIEQIKGINTKLGGIEKSVNGLLNIFN